MTGKRLNASVIINLNGNLTRRSREYSNQIGSLSRSGQGSLRALRTEVVRVSGAIDQMGAISTRTFRMLSAGALGIAGVGYTANKLFISAAAQREQQIIAMNSLYHGDKARADGMMAWAKQNAKETTWGLQGVLQEIRTATAFGMSDELVKQYISMLQNQGALHGWDLSAAQGASLQLKQMYARQKITAADASILTGYGINVYRVLADRLGVDEKVIRQRGEKGKLGLQSILMVFETLLKQSEGAQAAAMNSFDGMLAQIEANLLEFRVRVANSGPFEEIKNEMRRALDWHDAAGKSGELDALADTIGRKFLTTFRTIRQAAQEAWRWLKPGKDALAWVDQNIVSLKKLAAVLVSVWVANKLLRAGWAVAKPSWQVASYPFKTGRRIWHRMRNRRRGKGEVPAVDDLTFGSLMQGAGVQRVFVTNWPHGAGGYGSGGRRGNRGGRMPPRLPGGPLSLPGDPLSLPGPKPPALPAPRPVLALPPPKPPVPPPTGKAGLLARLANSAPGKVVTGMADSLAGAGRAAGGWLSALGGKIAGSAVGRVMSKGAETLGWMGKGAGRALTRLGGPLTGALMLAPVLMDEQASTREKAGATGSAAGAWLGGALGSLAGPLGTVAGATLGSVAGEYLGGFVTDLYQKWTAPDREPQKQTVNAEASLRVELGEGLRLTRSLVTEDGMGLNIYTGDNYITGW